MRIGRRDFLKGVGLCGVGAAGAGIATPCGVEAVNIFKTNPFEDEKKYRRYQFLCDQRDSRGLTDKEGDEYVLLTQETHGKGLQFYLYLMGAIFSGIFSALGITKGIEVLKGKKGSDQIQEVEKLVEEKKS